MLTAAAARPLWLTISVVLIGIGLGLYPSSGLTVLLFFILALSSLQGIYAVVPVFLVSEGGMSQSIVNFFFSLSRIIPVTALLFAGTLQDRIGLKRSLQVSLFGAGLCVLLMGLLHGTPLLLSVFLQPALGAALLLAVIGTIGNISSEADCSVTFSMMAPAAGLIGTGAVPDFIGFMGDAFTFSSAFIMVGALMLACCLLTVKLTLD